MPTERNGLAARVREEQAVQRRRRSPVPTATEMQCIIQEAHAAAKHAQETREKWRRRTHVNNSERVNELQDAYDDLLAVEKPIRRERSRAGKDHLHWSRWARKLAEASKAVQCERRKLWKMLPHPRP